MESLNNFLNQHRLPLILSFVGIVLIAGGILSSNLLTQPSKKLSQEQFKGSLVSQNNSTDIKVDISGAILNPGVYSLLSDDRVENLVKAAGGFEEDANIEYLNKSLNLASKLTDGQKIYIPFEGEDYQQAAVAGVSTGKIGINSANQQELESLPAVGPVTAQKIINQRPYQQISDLTAKKVVSRSVFEKIKDLVDLH